jgi:hypothetical protein
MGGNWGPLSVLALYGNVGIGTKQSRTEPAGDSSATRFPTISVNTSTIFSSKFAAVSGRTARDQWALVCSTTAQGVLQVKEANVGYNDLLLNPVAGNVGIGPLPPNCKLTIGAWEQAAYLNVKAASGGYELLMGADAAAE